MIANLFAKHMNSVVGKNNVYAYTFATPRVSVLAKKKDMRIFLII